MIYQIIYINIYINYNNNNCNNWIISNQFLVTFK